MDLVFHGDKNRDNHFWVYPDTMPLGENCPSWDTNDLDSYCTNYKYLHTFLDSGIKEYQCLGCCPKDEILIAILVKDKAACLPFYLQCIYQNYKR